MSALTAPLTSLVGCGQGSLSLSFDAWLVADLDIGVIEVRLPDDRLFLERTRNRHIPGYGGWDHGGALFPVDKYPSHCLISWRLPSPQENAYEKCVRRTESLQCRDVYPERQAFPRRDLRDGELVGPFTLSLAGRLNPQAIMMLSRSRATHHSLQVGIGLKSLRSPDFNIRWILLGTADSPRAEASDVTELARGGDW